MAAIKFCIICGAEFRAISNASKRCQNCNRTFCKVCKKEIGYRRKFCSHRCNGLYNGKDQERNDKLRKSLKKAYKEGRLPKVKAMQGNSEYIVKYQKAHKGENLETRECPMCKERFESSKKSSKVFCSIKCYANSCEGKEIRSLNGKKYGGLRKNRTWRGFFRKDLDCYFRSTWEANMARILDYEDVTWEFEKHKFQLEKGNYFPDFYLPDFGIFLEVKGWRGNGFEKMKEFYSLYPNIPLKILDKEGYKVLQEKYSDKIQNWEYAKAKKQNLRNLENRPIEQRYGTQ